MGGMQTATMPNIVGPGLDQSAPAPLPERPAPDFAEAHESARVAQLQVRNAHLERAVLELVATVELCKSGLDAPDLYTMFGAHPQAVADTIQSDYTRGVVKGIRAQMRREADTKAAPGYSAPPTVPAPVR